MIVGELALLLRKIRLCSPKTISSALIALEEALGDIFGVDICVLDIPSEKKVYSSRWIEGLRRRELSEMLELPEAYAYRWVVPDLERGEPSGVSGGAPFSILKVPLFNGRERVGAFSLIKRGEGVFDKVPKDSLDALSEVLSSVVVPLTGSNRRSSGELEEDSLRSELLEAVGDELAMREVLLKMMEVSEAEFCAFYTGADEFYLYVMLDGRELSPRIPYVRDKLITAYSMFANRQDERGFLHEKVYYSKREDNVAYLVGDSKIESYFLIPVTLHSSVRGVLFFGSVKRDAFVRESIGVFRLLAEDGAGGTACTFSLGGEMGVLEKVLDAVPFGGAIISRGGKITYANDTFGDVLQLRGSVPERIQDVARVSPFNLQGVWEEFDVLHKNLVGRELYSNPVFEATLSVTWIRFDDLSEDMGSLLLLKDVTDIRRLEREREEMIASVAHELRTPMTALKNSLKILMENKIPDGILQVGQVDGATLTASRFLETSLRTINRLSMLVDGLIDASSLRALDRPVRPERIEVKRYISDVSLIFTQSMMKKGIGFSIEVDESTSELMLDPDRMEQVIQNLLSNSLKNVPSGGRISISVSPCPEMVEGIFPLIPWKYIATPRLVDICVRDTGTGIPSEVVESINPSRERTTASNQYSRGLGLYIAKRLVEFHGGAMLIEEEQHIGSSVHLYIPIEPEIGLIVRTVRLIKESLDGMIGRGSTPTLYSIVKESSTCWLEIAGNWDTPPAVNPSRDEITDDGVYMWPFGEDFAIALTAQKRYARDPMSLIHRARRGLRLVNGEALDSIRIGWAVGPKDSRSYSELMAVSLERVGVEPIVTV